MHFSKEVIEWAIEECERQHVGPKEVGFMLSGWMYAYNSRDFGHVRPESMWDVLRIGGLVEPEKNRTGYRKVNVTAGGNRMLDHRLISSAMDRLIVEGTLLDNDAWYKEFEEIHPFVDGNGRVGSILWNWLNDTLENPIAPPNFWG